MNSQNCVGKWTNDHDARYTSTPQGAGLRAWQDEPRCMGIDMLLDPRNDLQAMWCSADDWREEYHHSGYLYMVRALIDHLALIHADRSRVDEFFALYVDPPKPKEKS